MKLRIRFNGPAIAQTAAVISNGVVLAANVYLLSSNIQQTIRTTKQARVSDSLQTAVEVAQSLGSLTKLITDIVEKNHVKNSSDI
ncbi:MAG: hypothetical protein HOG71_05560 [Bacteroidetes bacterium]|nr:hypothetical protein [Bacteroidota bacterium]MBT5990302.1 hypothetical protein [Bacteroidota bacterium]